MKQALSFDDVLLTPKYSTIKSRSLVDTSTSIGGIKLRYPILSANMATVTGSTMAHVMYKLGAMGVLDRTTLTEKEIEIVCSELQTNVIPSVGIDKNAFDFVDTYYELGCRAVCIDVAHGHSERVIVLAHSLLHKYSDLTVIAGNIATASAYKDFTTALGYADQERLVLKVGVGSGSLCSTRVVTGCGLPTLASLFQIAEVQEGAAIIADGGIKNSGDIVKALAAGADAVMLGSLLAGTDEAPGGVIKDDRTGSLYKVYQGSASFGIKKSHVGKTTHIEGAETLIPYKGSVVKVIQGLNEGITSGMSYVGAKTIPELQAKADFAQISAAGSIESRPHNLL